MASAAPAGNAGKHRNRAWAPCSQRSTAWRMLASRCQRSHTCKASGAPRAAPRILRRTSRKRFAFRRGRGRRLQCSGVAAANPRLSCWCGRAAGRSRAGAPGAPRSYRRFGPCASPSHPRPQCAAALVPTTASDGPSAAPCRHSPAWPSAAAVSPPLRRPAPHRPDFAPRPAWRSGAHEGRPAPAGARQRCAGRTWRFDNRTAWLAARHGRGARARAGQPGAGGSGCARHDLRARNPGSDHRVGCRGLQCEAGWGRPA